MIDFKDTQMILEMVYNGLFSMKQQAEQAQSSMKEECDMFQTGYVKGLADATEYIWGMVTCVDNSRVRENEERKERAEYILQLRGADNG